MSWMTSIISWLKSLEGYFYDAYLEAYSWVAPFWYLAIPLLYISRGFGWLAYYFSQFNEWLYNVNIKIGQILNWDTIWSLIKSFIPNWNRIGDWFADWWSNVTDIIHNWWSETSQTVQYWIAIATEGFNELLAAWDTFQSVTWPKWIGDFNKLKSLWETFASVTLPTLVNFSWLETWWNGKLIDIQSLIDSAFTTRDAFWKDWQEWKDKISEFFADPEDWLYKAADRIIERFW